MNNNDTKPSNDATEDKRPFTEPEVSDSVDVVKGNPAAGALFAVAGSGITGP